LRTTIASPTSRSRNAEGSLLGSRHVSTPTWCRATMLAFSWGKVAAKSLFRCRSGSMSVTFQVPRLPYRAHPVCRP
jgi:hypothetical protein